MARVRAVLLDVDGTLVDSNDAHARAWVDALAEAGRTVDLAAVRPLIGMGGDKLLPRLTGIDEASAEGERISTRRREIFLARYVPTLGPLPGAAALVHRMRRDGLRVVAATSAKRDELDALLRVAGVGPLDAVSSDDVDRSKPDPDVVAAALARAASTPAETVLVGDTPYDVAAARRAGVGAIALRSGGWSDRDLAAALAVYDDPADLLARWDASPLAAR